MFFNTLPRAVLCLLVSASALASSSAPAVGDKFSIYAYGDSLGGLPLFYANGKAFVGDSSNSSFSTTSNVTFERTSDSSTGPLVAKPNGTTSSNSSWSEELLYIPSSSSSSHEMGFTTEAGTNETTDGFIFYGQWMMVKTDSGEISSSFYVRSSSEGEGVYSLLWNVTDDDDTAVAVSLRTVAPSNA